MDLPTFFRLAGGQFEVRLKDACALAGINYQTACNQRDQGRFPIPVTKRSRNNVVVKIDDLYRYIYPNAAAGASACLAQMAVGRRGKPRREEVEAARAAGLSVPQLRRLRAGLAG